MSLYEIGLNFLQDIVSKKKHMISKSKKRQLKVEELEDKIKDYINLKKLEDGTA